ncbi:unnamed protein product [Arctogadus glacialis]
MVQASIAALTNLKDTPGLEEHGFQREFVDFKFKDITVTQNMEAYVRTFNTSRRQYIEQLIDALEKRFPRDDMNILKCFDLIFNPDRYPAGSHARGPKGDDQSECLEVSDAHDEFDSVNGSDDAFLFEEDGADPFQPVEEAGLRRTPRDLSTEGARGDDDGSPAIGTSLHDMQVRCHQAGNPMIQCSA